METKNSKNALSSLVEDFRMWNSNWEIYDKGQNTKPKSVDEFMNHLNEKYVVAYKDLTTI